MLSSADEISREALIWLTNQKELMYLFLHFLLRICGRWRFSTHESLNIKGLNIPTQKQSKQSCSTTSKGPQDNHINLVQQSP